MSKRGVLLVLLFLTAMLALAIGSRYLAVINIEGDIDVGEIDVRNVEEITVKLDINTPMGSKKFTNITTINIASGEAIKFRVVEKHVEGNITIVLNGLAVLKSRNTTYKIPLPCILEHGEPCVRVQTLIPGYDVPMTIIPGTYTVDLTLEWKADGKGRFIVKLVIEHYPALKSQPEIRVIGVKPENTNGWVTVPGSTRTYALIVEKNRVKTENDGVGTVKAYAWMFTSEKTNYSTIYFVFKLIDHATGQVLAELETKPYSDSMYHRILVEIKAPKGEYILRLEIIKSGTTIVLEAPLIFY